MARHGLMVRLTLVHRMVLSHVRTIPELLLLGSGSQSVKRLPIFSFLVRHPRGTFLHHNFVCAVLNDVFGIQARGGCACAGPYAQDLLGIDEDLAAEYEAVLLEDSRRLDRTHLRRQEEHSNFEMLRPGFARISLPFFMGDAEVAFVLEALKMVATEAWKLLPQYILNPETGEWRHHTNSAGEGQSQFAWQDAPPRRRGGAGRGRDRRGGRRAALTAWSPVQVFRDRKWLGHIRYVDGKMTVNERRVSGCGTFPQDHADVLQTARNIFNKARKVGPQPVELLRAEGSARRRSDERALACASQLRPVLSSRVRLQMAQRYPLADQCVMFDAQTEGLRWFMLPSEAQDLLLGNSHNVKHDVPFQPAVYGGSRGSVSEGSPAPSVPTSAPSPVPPAASPNGLPPAAVAVAATRAQQARAAAADAPPTPPSPPTRTPPPRLASPRHSSLPCIDKHLSAPLQPLPLSDSCDGAFAAGIGGGASSGEQAALQQPVTLLRPLHFAVGEAVTPPPLLTSPLARSPVHAHAPHLACAHSFGGGSRTRCHSLGSSSQVSPPVLSPVTMANLGLVAPAVACDARASASTLAGAGRAAHGVARGAPAAAGRRSCSSQTDLHSLELGAAGGVSPLSSLGLLQLAAGSYNDCSTLGHPAHHPHHPLHALHPAPSQSPEDLHAYVNEVTKQITAEIKSEIREVISKVEDVLSDSGEPHLNGYEKTRSNSGSSGGGGDNGIPSPSPSPAPSPAVTFPTSLPNLPVTPAADSARASTPASNGGGGPVSALEVAEYLMGMSREMASEMKSEIREMVSAVDCLISPDYSGAHHHYHQHACTAPRPGSAASGAASPRSPRSPRSPTSPPSATATSPDPSSAPDVSLAGPSPFLSSKAVSLLTVSGACLGAQVADLAGERTQSSECSSDETVIHVMAGRDPAGTAASSPAGGGGAGADPGAGSGRSEEDGEDGDGWEDDATCGAAGATRHALLVRSTINSVSSQDSGINLTFHESDSSSPGNTLAKDCTGARRRKTNLSAGSTGGVGSLQQLSRAALDLRRRCDVGSCYVTEEELSERTAEAEETATVTLSVVGLENGVARWHCPPKAIWKPAVEALQEFDMIRDGDRVMVCLSGGKDSLSLLHTLHQYQFYARAKGVHFILGAATVDPGSTAYDPRPLIPYMESLGVHYLYEEQPILQQAAALDRCTSVCSFCSRMKRGRLYAAARKHGYNVLALGQHLDDLSESFLMSVFHNGRLRSMKAHYYIRERDLRVIRPFVYVREKALRQFAESRKLPVIPENCPACFEAPKASFRIFFERHRSKQLLAQQEILFPKLFWSLRSALHPLISFRYTGEESRQYMRHRKHSQSHAAGAPTEVDDSSDTDEEPVA
ncbi:Cytoplasmic tRNA 2-thiolation protein 1 [Gryllus bimaculatus]|nr:Cytoplasmic tRNA 2-thiolation protein 1 [Gryllus bimaculatus]